MNLWSRRQDGWKPIVWTMILCLGAGLVGCTSWTKPFMGVQEWRTVLYEDDDPQTPFRGVPKLTAVRKADYRHYLAMMRLGRIVVEEKGGGWVYYAVRNMQSVPLTSTSPDEASSVLVVVTERYKASMPEEPPSLMPTSSQRLKAKQPAVRQPAKSELEKSRKQLQKQATAKAP